MLSFLGAESRARVAARLDVLGGKLAFRIAIACVLALLHLAAFSAAGHARLHLPFDSSPAERPYYADTHASAVGLAPRQPSHWSRLIVSRWDAQHYIGFALNGLAACPDDASATDAAYLQCGLGWYPAYGLAGGVVARTTGLPADTALVLLSILAAIAINFLWTSGAVTARLGRLEAYGALLAFNLFPTAFYVVTPLTESLTLALALGAFVCLANQRWLLAAALVGAATTMRAAAISFAFGFGAAALIAAWRRRRDAAPQWWRPLVAIPIAAWGQVAQLVLFKIFVGDATAYLRARAAFGDQLHGARLVEPSYVLRAFTSQHMDGVMLVGTLAIIALTARRLYRSFRIDEFTFLAVTAVATLILLTIGPREYWGINRFLLLCPITFFGLGVMLRQHTAAFVLWLGLSAAIYWHVELCSYVTQGNPGVCPALGRFEVAMPFNS